jgi:hypothetical protein
VLCFGYIRELRPRVNSDIVFMGLVYVKFLLFSCLCVQIATAVEPTYEHCGENVGCE